MAAWKAASSRPSARFGLFCTASVVSRSPSPETSMPPPSSSKGKAKRRTPRCAATLAGTWLSSEASNLPPQPWNSQSVSATSPVRACLTKMGPWSRHQTSSVAISVSSMTERSALAARSSRSASARSGPAALMRTGWKREMAAANSANFAGMRS